MDKHITIDLIEQHKRRISRSGKELWNFMRSIKPGDCISGIDAMKIKDNYGIRPSDIIFFLSILDAHVNMEEFYKLLEEEYNKPQTRCAL